MWSMYEYVHNEKSISPILDILFRYLFHFRYKVYLFDHMKYEFKWLNFSIFCDLLSSGA